jgi:RimJ/RimL family protein N-acetyltransferase
MEKNGMTFEGIKRGGALIKGTYRDVGACSILRSEFFEKN